MFSALVVISANALDFVGSFASGDAEGAGVGNAAAGVGGASEVLRLALGTVVFLLRGETDFVGDAGSLGALLSSRSRAIEGPTLSPDRALRVRTVFFGDTSVPAVVCLRVGLRGVFFGAGVNSSSCPCSSWTRLNSSSESSSSTMVFRAARRNGRAGDSIAGRFIRSTWMVHWRM